MLSISNLHAGYGKVEVLHGISLEVPKGKVVTLIGSNGAGKTTTMRAISGMIKPVSGTVTLGGKDITGLDSHRISRAGLAHQTGIQTKSTTDLQQALFSVWQIARLFIGEVGQADKLQQTGSSHSCRILLFAATRRMKHHIKQAMAIGVMQADQHVFDCGHFTK